MPTRAEEAQNPPEDADTSSEPDQPLVSTFEGLSSDDVPIVGGKNASLGEMISALRAQGVDVPTGFATTARAYRAFLDANDLNDRIAQHCDRLDGDPDTLSDVGKSIRKLFDDATFPDDLESAIRGAYADLAQRLETDTDHPAVAVRSSATAEDLPEASFAGQQETFLNVRGPEELLDACRRCFASLFTDRAISYREDKGFDHLDVALSVGVQEMVRADTGASGVMFTIDTETGFPDAIVIDAAWGLGETVVGGEVDPDEFVVFKPLLDDHDLRPILSRRLGEKKIKAVYAKKGNVENTDTSEDERNTFALTDDEVLTLARWGAAIERHYERPMDIEWAKDGESGAIKIVQARPETVQSQQAKGVLTTYSIKQRSDVLVEGLAVGNAVASGKVRVLDSPDQGADFQEGDVLVARVTDPDWGPIMERAGAVVTDHGGRTAHAAIVSRELGIPAVVGAGNATSALDDGREVTVSCCEGDTGFVYDGALDYESNQLDLQDVPETRTRIMMNIASPAGAFRWHALPAHGIGLARIEFIIANTVRVHPMALVHPDRVQDDDARDEIDRLTHGYDDKTEYFVDRLAEGMARIAASQYPDPVIVRTSDFKTNEYAQLIGGRAFEPDEENPMLGFRGASRYDSDRYRDGFALECRAIRRVRDEIGLDNVIVMIPFCRTLDEADGVLRVMGRHGLARGERGLKIYVMAEIPANVLLAEQFAERFDGFSIGSNDLTQLTLGIDRDSSELAPSFDERNDAVTSMIRMLIDKAHHAGRPVGICGQAPSDHPDFAEFLVRAGIDTISLNPDSVLPVLRRVAELERTLHNDNNDDNPDA